MLRELTHFLRYAPSAGRLRKEIDRVAFFDHVERQLDRAGKARWRAALEYEYATLPRAVRGQSACPAGNASEQPEIPVLPLDKLSCPPAADPSRASAEAPAR